MNQRPKSARPELAGQVRIFVTLDADQDHATGLHPARNEVRWESLRLLPRIATLLGEHGIRFTLFLRCDDQIHDLFGRSLALYENNREIFDPLRAAGNEIGWHPHLYQRTTTGYQPIRDADLACAQLDRVWSEIRKSELRLTSVRLGEAWHSGKTMRLLDAMGFLVDSTALPGRSRHDSELEFDWIGTPNYPYHPSVTDPRLPDPTAALNILEVPMTTAPILTAYDATPLRRYLNPTFHAPLFAQALDAVLDDMNADSTHTLVLTFHPSELLPQSPDGLCSQDWATFSSNLTRLVESVQRQGLEYSFRCISEAANETH